MELDKLLKENWELLQEIFELPKNINTKSYGDDFFSNGQYGESFDFKHEVTGKSGKKYTMVFRFMRRYLKTDQNASRSYQSNNKKGQSEISIPESEIPTYEISFYPEETEGTKNQWALLNDISPSQIIAANCYFVLYHAHTLLNDMVPSPFVDYMFRPYKEKHETDLAARDTKRGEFYNRALPKALEQIQSNFKDIKVTKIDTHPEYTIVKVTRA